MYFDITGRWYTLTCEFHVLFLFFPESFSVEHRDALWLGLERVHLCKVASGKLCPLTWGFYSATGTTVKRDPKVCVTRMEVSEI